MKSNLNTIQSTWILLISCWIVLLLPIQIPTIAYTLASFIGLLVTVLATVQLIRGQGIEGLLQLGFLLFGSPLIWKISLSLLRNVHNWNY